jgi:hypothetical protein
MIKLIIAASESERETAAAEKVGERKVGKCGKIPSETFHFHFQIHFCTYLIYFHKQKIHRDTCSDFEPRSKIETHNKNQNQQNQRYKIHQNWKNYPYSYNSISRE